MRLYRQLTLPLLLGVLIAACAPTAVPTQEPAVHETQSTLLAELHPLDTRTGIEEIDTVLDAIAHADVQRQRELINFTTAPCTFADGLGGPPKCRQAETEGTKVEVLSFLGGEGTFLRRDESVEWGGVDAMALYAIYRVSENVNEEEYYPAGEYAIMFIAALNRPAISVRVSDGGIVRIDHIFDTAPEALNAIIEREAAEVILAPNP